MGPLARRPAPGDRTVVAVEPRWLKLVSARGRTITTVAAIPLPAEEEAADPAALSQALRVAGALASAPLVALSSHLTSARLLTVPSTDPQEIRQIVELQVEQHTPHAKDEVFLDSLVVTSDSSGYSRTLLVIAHRDAVFRAVHVVEGARWAVQRVGCELEGLVHWFRAVQPELSGRTVLIADVDQEATTVLILHEGQPYFHRSVTCGASQLVADAVGATATFVGELQRSVEVFEAEGFQVPLTEMVLTGQAERIPGLVDQVQPFLGIPTRVLSMREGCVLAPTAAAALESLPPVSVTGLLGLALGGGQLDLTPPAVSLRQLFEHRARAVMRVGYQLVALLLLAALLALGRTYRDERQRERLLREQGVIAAQADDVARSLDALHLVKNRLPQRGEFLSILDVLSRVALPEIRLDSVAYAVGEPVVLKGVSQELPKVYEFVSAMGKEPGVRAVEARRVSRRKVEGQDVTEFEIAFTMTRTSS